MWAVGFQLQDQILIMENNEFLLTQHTHTEDDFRDIIVLIIKDVKIFKQYVTRCSF